MSTDSLPYDHPIVVEALTRSPIVTQEAAARLAAHGTDIRLLWRDPIPERAHGEGPIPACIFLDAFHQERDEDQPVGSKSGTSFRTARIHHLTTDDHIDLSLPVWRWGRRDLPHDPAHTPQDPEACDECGTGAYWLLPQYLRPAWEPGLSDPENKTLLRGDILMMLGLSRGGKRMKVVMTDHARYARGMPGRPEPVKVARLMDVVRRPDGDKVIIKFRNNGSSVLRPDEVELKEFSTSYAALNKD